MSCSDEGRMVYALGLKGYWYLENEELEHALKYKEMGAMILTG